MIHARRATKRSSLAWQTAAPYLEFMPIFYRPCLWHAFTASALAVCLSLAPGISNVITASEEEVDALLAELAQAIPPDELAEPGSLVWPQTVAEAAEQAEELGLGPEGAMALKLASAEAWLAAGEHQRAATDTQELLKTGALNDSMRRRAGLSLVASWQALVEAGADEDAEAAIPTDPLEALAEFGAFDALVIARAHVVAGVLAFADPGTPQTASLEHFDQALSLLIDEAPIHRTPVFTLRLHAMELADDDMAAIRRWLDQYQDDPGLQPILDAIFTASQNLIGQAAPALEAPRLDGKAGAVTLPAGTPTLVFFSASWSQQSANMVPVVVELQNTLKEAIAVIEVSLDTKDTTPQIAAYMAKHGITHPIIGESLGWDGELDDAWHIDGIPSVLLVDGKGRVASQNLASDDANDTKQRILNAIEQLKNVPSEADTDQQEE